jgi:protein SCO1/2
MKRLLRLAWLCIVVSLGASTLALAERPLQRVNLTYTGWPLGPFSLVDHRGARFTLDNLHGYWTLLLLGDSRCGEPCEAALSALAGLYRRIGRTQAIQTMQVVLVSPDPHGDSPERLAQYLARFDPRFIGAVGSRHALQGLADDLGATLPGLACASSSGPASPGGSGSIWVIGPDAILRAELLPPFDVLPLTAELMRTRARR